MSESIQDRREVSLRERLRENPEPAMRWAAVAAVLVALEFGAVAGAVMSIPWGFFMNPIADAIPGVGAIAGALAAGGDFLADLPTLLSREFLRNRGHRIPGGQVFRFKIGIFPFQGDYIRFWWWSNTFPNNVVPGLWGWPAAIVWGIRVALIYLYSFVWLAWLWKGYNVFRDHYRYAEWTPTDDIIDRFSRHTWGKFGFVVIAAFLTMAIFAPSMAPTEVHKNIMEPYSYRTAYLADSGQVKTILIGDANIGSRSLGYPEMNFGPLDYDPYDRFHPFGTIDNGKDMFTTIAAGSRISLFIGLVAVGISGTIAFSLAMITAFYKGLTDLTAVVISDSVEAMPQLLMIIMLSVVLGGTWIANVYDGGLLLALLFGSWSWPGLWRAVRGPSYQVVESEWIDAAKSYGQTPRKIMTKHMAPYVVSYLLIYASLALGGIILSTAALSFIGVGITEPTPEWGRIVNRGQSYVPTVSWHISILPGILIVIVVTGFNALGDGIRDAIDPQSEGGSGSDANETAAAGGGG